MLRKICGQDMIRKNLVMYIETLLYFIDHRNTVYHLKKQHSCSENQNLNSLTLNSISNGCSASLFLSRCF